MATRNAIRAGSVKQGYAASPTTPYPAPPLPPSNNLVKEDACCAQTIPTIPEALRRLQDIAYNADHNLNRLFDLVDVLRGTSPRKGDAKEKAPSASEMDSLFDYLDQLQNTNYDIEVQIERLSDVISYP